MKSKNQKNQLPTFKKMYDNLKSYYTGDNKDWYIIYHNFLNEVANAYNLPLYKIVGIFAAYSTNASIDQNLLFLRKFLKTPYNCVGMKSVYVKASKIYMYGENEDIVFDILSRRPLGDYNSAYKLRSFFINLMYPISVQSRYYHNTSKTIDYLDVVTIDRHAIRACQYDCTIKLDPDKDINSSKKIYKEVSAVYNALATDLNILPQELQASCWVKFRQVNGLAWYSNKEKSLKKQILENSYVLKEKLIA